MFLLTEWKRAIAHAAKIKTPQSYVKPCKPETLNPKHPSLGFVWGSTFLENDRLIPPRFAILATDGIWDVMTDKESARGAFGVWGPSGFSVNFRKFFLGGGGLRKSLLGLGLLGGDQGQAEHVKSLGLKIRAQAAGGFRNVRLQVQGISPKPEILHPEP